MFLSATLGSKGAFCKEIGIEEKECFFVETDSPFPADKSPVIVMPSIKLSKGFYEQSINKIGGLVDSILDIHEEDRGIIHCIESSTDVLMSDGLKRKISLINEGDSVISWSGSEFEPKLVTAVYDNGLRDCIELKFDNGKTLICTPDHRILTKQRGYIQANDLLESDEILDEAYISLHQAT